MPGVAGLLHHTQWRLLQIRPVYSPDLSSVDRRPAAPTRFHATYFDYPNNRAVLISGDINHLADVEVWTTDEQPQPSPEEFHAALDLLRQHQWPIAQSLNLGAYTAGPTIPPLRAPTADRPRRAIRISLLPRDAAVPQRIETVELGDAVGTLIDDEVVVVVVVVVVAPPGTKMCGIQEDTNRIRSGDTAGAAWVTIRTLAGSELWSFLAIRPAATGDSATFAKENTGEASATNGAGIELWDVRYKGQRVLARAHVPIINVKYDRTSTGDQGRPLSPLRDWGYEEGQFQANLNSRQRTSRSTMG